MNTSCPFAWLPTYSYSANPIVLFWNVGIADGSCGGLLGQRVKEKDTLIGLWCSGVFHTVSEGLVQTGKLDNELQKLLKGVWGRYHAMLLYYD